jgi:hypothetical protein
LRNVDKIFFDKRVEECCQEASSFLGFPLGDVLPQANYSEEVIPNDEKDFITLFNLYHMMKRAEDYVKDFQPDKESVL